MKHSETKPQQTQLQRLNSVRKKSIGRHYSAKRRIPLGSKQKAERDSSRKIGAQNDDFLNFSAEEFKD